ncbi:MAG: VanW family protein [Bacillus sp. (in: firmicutes)]
MKRKWKFMSFLLLCVLAMQGCSSGESADRDTETSKENQVVEKEKEKAEDEREVHVQEPVEITVVDPETSSILRVIQPEEMGFKTDPVAYENILKTWARELARGKDGTPGYDKRQIADRVDVNGQIVKGSPQIILDEGELVSRLMAASDEGGEVELPLTVTASGYVAEEVARMDETVIASYSTHFNAADTGRSKNIELSAKALDGVIVGVGDIVSFNGVVGPRTPERGYQPAPEIVNKKKVMGIGGGVCQTSSTLFNAVDQLAVDYVEWHHHSLNIGYVPAGRDATVSYGGLDFRFKNNSGIPFKLRTIHSNGRLTIEIRTSSDYASQMKKSV